MELINWNNALEKSNEFKEKTPTKWIFLEGILNREFYEELRNTYPEFDNNEVIDEYANYTNKWWLSHNFDNNSYRKFWKENDKVVIHERDERYSDAWNRFMEYAWSDDFIKKLVELTGVQVTNLKHFAFALNRQDNFQLPHTHNTSDKTLIVFFYFSNNWQKGDPGGTYLSDGEDESKILFEVDNLDNTILIVHDGPYASHGSRQIIKDVERKAVQLVYENYSSDGGWATEKRKEEKVLLDL